MLATINRLLLFDSRILLKTLRSQGNKYIEKILFYLSVNQQCYGSELKNVFEAPINGIQEALNRLERGQILVSKLVGRTRIYQYHPTNPLVSPLKTFVVSAYAFVPDEIKEKYYERIIRTRPRKKGKI